MCEMLRPGGTNNFRNTSGLQYYSIPKDAPLRKKYKCVIQNKTLKLESDNSRICSEHFNGYLS